MEKNKTEMITMLLIPLLFTVGSSVIIPLWGFSGLLKALSILLCTLVLALAVFIAYGVLKSKEWTKKTTIIFIVVGILIIVAYYIAFFLIK